MQRLVQFRDQHSLPGESSRAEAELCSVCISSLGVPRIRLDYARHGTGDEEDGEEVVRGPVAVLTG